MGGPFPQLSEACWAPWTSVSSERVLCTYRIINSAPLPARGRELDRASVTCQAWAQPGLPQPAHFLLAQLWFGPS